MSDFETVRYAVDQGVALITLNRPAVLNAFNGQMRRDLLAAVRRAIDDAGARVVVLTGEGRGFSAGADLADGIPPLVQQQIDEEYKPVLMAISEAPKPFISAVNGEPPATTLAIPGDFVQRMMQGLGLSARETGLTAMVARLKRHAREAQAAP